MKKAEQNKIHLSVKHRTILENLFHKYLPGVEVWAYGSRVNGESHGGSDLDLVLLGPGLKKIDFVQFLDMKDALTESNIPFLVEARDWARLPKNFHKEIKKNYYVLIKNTKPAVPVKTEAYQIKSQKNPQRSFPVKSAKTKIPQRAFTPEESTMPAKADIQSFKKQPSIYSKNKLGEIPENWSIVKLGDACTTTSGGTPLRSNKVYYEGGKIAWIKSGEVNHNVIYQSDEKITKSGLKNSSAKIFPVNTVLIAMYGATAGKVGLLKFESATNQAICGVLPNKKFISEFLYMYLKTKTNYMKQLSSGGAQQNISQEIIRNLKIPVPPLEEQKKIAGVLSQIQQAVEVQDKLIKFTTELKKSTMKHLFTYGTKEQKTKQTEIDLLSKSLGQKELKTSKNNKSLTLKQTELGPLPQNWKLMKIENLFNLKQGKSLSSKNQTGLYLKPFLRTSNVFWGYLDLTKVDEMDIPDKDRKTLQLKKDDLLVCEGGDIGRTAIWNEELKECYHQNHIHRLRVKNTNIFPLFYMYWMNFSIKQANVYGTFGNRTTIPNLSGKRLLQFLIPVPPLEEQKKIAGILQKIDKKIETHQNKKTALNALFKTMLNKLMTAQIRTHHLNFNASNLLEQSL